MHMVAYKKQHFLPCAYLQFFSADGTWADARKAQVYFTDGTKSALTRVANLAVVKYAYSKSNPEFDKQFHQMEADYPTMVERMLAGVSEFRAPDYFGFWTMMVDFNLRSVAYENRSEVERRHTYEAISRSFNSEVFCETTKHGTDLQEMLDWLVQHWRLRLLSPGTAERFITSDNPSTIYVEPERSLPVMIYLPIHPRLAVMAYDTRSVVVTGDRISDDALSVLNGIQLLRSVRHAFADHDLATDLEEWPKVQRLMARERPERWVDGKRWQPDFISIRSEAFDRFSFLQRA